MANKDLQKERHNINPFWWWYEMRSGIKIYHKNPDSIIGKESPVIPWRSIRAALKRKDRK